MIAMLIDFVPTPNYDPLPTATVNDLFTLAHEYGHFLSYLEGHRDDLYVNAAVAFGKALDARALPISQIRSAT